MAGCIYLKLAPFSAGTLGFWWLRLPKGLFPNGSQLNAGLLKDAAMGYISIQTDCFVLWTDLYRA